MARRVVLWVAFAVVHVGVAVGGWVLPGRGMGDVYLVYEPWTRQALAGDGVVGITESWVYPQLALVPMVLTTLFSWIAGYIIGWAILVTVIDAVAFAILVGRARSRGRVRAAWFWLAFIAVLGPAGMYRIDAVTVPLAILGCLWLARRPWLASTVLAIGVWIKVWPAALLAAAFVTLRRRFAVVGGALVTSGLVIVAVVLAEGAGALLGFVDEQTDRGLQLEAPVSTPYVWLAAGGAPGVFAGYSTQLNTYQVTGPGAEVLSAVMTPLLVAVVAALAVLGAVAVRRGASFAVVFPPLSLALTLALIVVNKVGSPQFQTWLIAPFVLALVLDRRRWARPALLALGIALLTQLVYPVNYDRLLMLDPLIITLLTVRNALLVVLLVLLAIRLVRVIPSPVRDREVAAVRT